MGAQKKIVKKIVEKNEADYVINLKGNQETLQKEVEGYFDELEQSGKLAKIREQTEQASGIGVYQSLEKVMGASKDERIFIPQIWTGWWMLNATGLNLPALAE